MGNLIILAKVRKSNSTAETTRILVSFSVSAGNGR